MPEQSYSCSSCGLRHTGMPLSFAADYPDPYQVLSTGERDARATISSDQCIIDGEQFYLRGCLELPIRGTQKVFLWGLWARVNEAAFDAITDHWEVEGRELKIGPYSGRLANSLSIYPDTLNLKLEVQIKPVGSRPLFWLEEPAHLLCQEQLSGITEQEAANYSCLLMRLAGK